jgi:hypothetical protein
MTASLSGGNPVDKPADSHVGLAILMWMLGVPGFIVLLYLVLGPGGSDSNISPPATKPAVTVTQIDQGPLPEQRAQRALAAVGTRLSEIERDSPEHKRLWDLVGKIEQPRPIEERLEIFRNFIEENSIPSFAPGEREFLEKLKAILDGG